MRIFLIGLPGSGKTTLGRELSSSLNLKFLDTDILVEAKAGLTISEIFKERGESHFRKLENEVLNEILETEHVIISTGGGLPCFYDNMETILSSGICVFLNVPVESIVQRLKMNANDTRPLIEISKDDDMIQLMRQKLNERLGYYQRAQIQLTDENITTAKVVESLKLNGIIS